MAFPSDSAAFLHVGPYTDEGALTAVTPGAVIGGGRDDESDKLVTNAHRNYTNGNRARLVHLTGPPASATSGLDQAFAQTTSGALTEVASVPLPRAVDRTVWTLYVDAADADCEVDVVNSSSGAVITSGAVAGGASRAQGTDSLTVTTGLGSNLHAKIKINALGLSSATGYLYALRIYEDATTT
jgi:hypothetical protein